MADEYNSEVFMRLVDKNGNPVAAECQTEVDSDMDDLISEYFNGEFFAIDDFHYGMSIQDQDATADSANKTGGKGVAAPLKQKPSGPQVKFGKWKSATSDEIKKMKFPLKVDEFTVTRRYDKASPILFDKCSRSEGFPQASIVKRKVVGDAMLQAFMKFTFEDVLITRIQFQESDVLKETLTFIFRKMTFQYRTQSASGTLNPPGQVSLDYAAKLREQTEGT